MSIRVVLEKLHPDHLLMRFQLFVGLYDLQLLAGRLLSYQTGATLKEAELALLELLETAWLSG
jgi:hypothetical protein